MKKKAKLLDRFKNILSILLPLIFSSLGNIDSIANAMDLRGFGKDKRRTWYAKQRPQKADYIAFSLCLFIFLGSIALTLFINKSRFFNPFI